MVFLDHIIRIVSFIITIFLIYKIIKKKYQMLNFTFKLKYKRKTLKKEIKIKIKKKKHLYRTPLNFYLALNYW